MSDDDNTNDPEQQDDGGSAEAQQQGDEKTFTQADVDRFIQDRLAKERKKYEGFDQYKQQAEELAQIKDSEKSEIERLQEQLQESSTQLSTTQSDLARYKALAAYPVSEDYQDLVHGTDEESYLASAKKAHELEQRATASEQDGKRRQRNPIDDLDKRISDKGLDLDSQIAQAQSEGDWTLAGQLKAQKLATN